MSLAATVMAAQQADAAEPAAKPAAEPAADEPARDETAKPLAAPAPTRKRRVEWSASWNRFNIANYIVTGVAAGSAIGIGLGTDFRSDGTRSGILFDEPLREVLLAGDRRGRDAALHVGDYLYRSMLLYPYLVDTLLAAWIGHGSIDVAAQMFLINTQSLAVAALISLSTEHFIGRARPSTTPCEANDEHERFCDGSDEFASFISGHTAMAATSAGLICAHHSRLPLYGGGWPDALACVAGVSAATATGLARVINDRHWASDVLMGGAVGAFAGYVLPMWLHYGFEDRPFEPEADAAKSTFVPLASPDLIGGSWVGAF